MVLCMELLFPFGFTFLGVLKMIKLVAIAVLIITMFSTLDAKCIYPGGKEPFRVFLILLLLFSFELIDEYRLST